MKKSVTINKFFIFVLVAFFIGIWVGNNVDTTEYRVTENSNVINKETNTDVISKDIDFNMFWDVWNTIEEKYVDQPIEQRNLFYGAMYGLVAGLDDPYSTYFSPEVAQEFQQDLKGSFEGIGAEIGIKENNITVVTPLDGSPAQQAGLRSGDIILQIDDVDATGITLEKAVQLIRGEKGTNVDLVIARGRDIQTITVTRDTIQVESVTWEILGNTAYIKVRTFNDDTDKKLRQASREILKLNNPHIILDLRNNPGGFLDQAISVSGMWIDGNVVVKEKKNDGVTQTYEGTGSAIFQDIPTIVLINEASASASEIVAGALQDYDAAILIGETSFGKGSVQEYEEFSDGSALKLTIAHWYTPNDRLIEGEGIDPDYFVEMTLEDFDQDRDPQLDIAKDILSQCKNLSDCSLLTTLQTDIVEE